jgi:AbrB family looped-hinge helix DNA binding protein
MNVSIDKFGRLVLPKIVRNHLGLEAGSELELEEIEGKIMLKVIEGHILLKEEEGVLVFTGKAIGNIDETLLQVREERLQHLSGF